VERRHGKSRMAQFLDSILIHSNDDPSNSRVLLRPETITSITFFQDPRPAAIRRKILEDGRKQRSQEAESLRKNSIFLTKRLEAALRTHAADFDVVEAAAITALKESSEAEWAFSHYPGDAELAAVEQLIAEQFAFDQDEYSLNSTWYTLAKVLSLMVNLRTFR
jgi:hypothetical protein